MPIPRGRIAKVLKIKGVRSLDRKDLDRLTQPRANHGVSRFRDSHHRVARLYATGLRHAEVMEATGYSYQRLLTLHGSPAMQELIARYREKVNDEWAKEVDAFYSLATRNMLAAERQLSDRIDEADELGETLPVRELIAISSDRADRFGYPKKAQNLNINVDFAAQLERAIQRSGKQIDGQARVVAPSLNEDPRPRPLLVRRRA